MSPTSSADGHSADGMQKNPASEHVVTLLPPDWPARPVNAQRTIAVSLIEFAQHPLLACENNNQSFDFTTCSALELDSAINANEVS